MRTQLPYPCVFAPPRDIYTLSYVTYGNIPREVLDDWGDDEKRNGFWEVSAYNIAPSSLTFNEYLDRWLKHKGQGQIAANTHEHYTENLNRYIKPLLGGFRLCALQPLDIQNVYNDLLKRVSARTVRYAHSVLSSALKQAVKWKMIPSNPAALVDLPKKKQKEMQAITSVDAPRFLAAAKVDRYFALFAFILETGLRPSECFALRRSDIDFERTK